MKPFRGQVLVFCFFVLVQALSAAGLFALKVGLTPARVATAFAGDGELVRPRSLTGLLEVLVPHLLAIPLTLFILIHLVGWVLGLPAALVQLRRLTFFLTGLGLLAGAAVRFVWPGLAVVKLGAFLGQELTLLLWVGLVVRAALVPEVRA